MKCNTESSTLVVALLALIAALPLSARVAGAHCDTLGGPVVASARIALEQGDVTPVLMWVGPEYEDEITRVFSSVLAVRELSPRAMEMADTYFFETLVRIHREGEGAPYTGLKPAGAVDPAVAMADQALQDGSIDGLAEALANKVEAGVRDRFARAEAAKKHADESVESGRDFVEAYVAFTHYVERMHLIATANGGHNDLGGDEAAPVHEH